MNHTSSAKASSARRGGFNLSNCIGKMTGDDSGSGMRQNVRANTKLITIIQSVYLHHVRILIIYSHSRRPLPDTALCAPDGPPGDVASSRALVLVFAIHYCLPFLLQLKCPLYQASAVAILPVLRMKGELTEVILISQYRPPLGRSLFPAIRPLQSILFQA